MAPHELTDVQFALIVLLLPTGTRRGRPWNDHRRVVNGVFWKLNTGVPWLPDRYGSWKTLYDRFVLW
ncbi:transposase [Herpetosiphon gulosus]|uniref:Insertion element IS402-like domain-containing protein n=1 Tax=Herpetosiphon gulosus TaxID=1973496 RepID=A0ABP9X0F7_9CHLR